MKVYDHFDCLLLFVFFFFSCLPTRLKAKRQRSRVSESLFQAINSRSGPKGFEDLKTTGVLGQRKQESTLQCMVGFPALR